MKLVKIPSGQRKLDQKQPANQRKCSRNCLAYFATPNDFWQTRSSANRWCPSHFRFSPLALS